MHIHYQDGYVYQRGKRIRKWKGRIRKYEANGKAIRSEVTLGLVSKMSKSDAKKRLRDLLLGSVQKTSLPDVTFGEYWREHYIPLRRSGWSEPTEQGYKGYMKYLVLPAFEHIALKDIDPVLIARLFSEMKGRCGYWAMRRVRTLLKAIFEEALNDNFVVKNPLRRIKTPNTPSPLRPVLPKDDAAKLMQKMAGNKSAEGIRDYAIIRIGVFCAVRPAEVFGLRWGCDLGGELFIQHSAWEGRLYERHPKKAKPRKVALDRRTHWHSIAGEKYRHILTHRP